MHQKKITSKQFKVKYGFKKRLTEDEEQSLLCKWIKENYPNVLYTVDLAGIKLQQHQKRIMSSRAKKGHPDLIIQEWYQDKYCGLAIEFKRTGESVCKLNGYLKKNEHLQRQLEYLIELKERFYIAGFVCGLENAKKVIRAYLDADSKSIEIINEFIYPKILF